MSTDQLNGRGPAYAEWNMRQRGAGNDLKKLTGEVRGAARARRRHHDLPRPGF